MIVVGSITVAEGRSARSVPGLVTVGMGVTGGMGTDVWVEAGGGMLLDVQAFRAMAAIKSALHRKTGLGLRI